ncbi:hypothetical protein NDU88_005854 [Pleurodeles waltl]|uniref:Uncharacterized protein n=1 Tax=Pleurodeles waltl TaxID=8319 RepID=A0AAV7UJV0_PLEWA|nr:hypothetical protein NDU88_005854 [Pleurodeles waltl]
MKTRGARARGREVGPPGTVDPAQRCLWDRKRPATRLELEVSWPCSELLRCREGRGMGLSMGDLARNAQMSSRRRAGASGLPS